MPTSDADSATTDTVYSQVTAQAGTWTHLVGEYDQYDRLSIYVNGTYSGSSPHTKLWSARGPLVIGRGKANDAPDTTTAWRGGIADVQAYTWNLHVASPRVSGPADTVSDLENTQNAPKIARPFLAQG